MKIVLSLFSLIVLSSCGEPNCDVSKLNTTMSQADVVKLCGKPNYTNASTDSKQMVYRKPFLFIGGTYIYIRDGRFSSAQWEE